MMINKLLNQWVNEWKIDQNTYQAEYNNYDRKIFKEDKNENILNMDCKFLISF